MIRIMMAVATTIMVFYGNAQQKSMNDRSPEGKWLITSLMVEGKLKDVATKAYYIEFGKDGQVNAKICNSMGGKFNLDGNAISFGPLRSTKMMCPDMQNETAFSRSLAEADTIEYNKSRIILKKGNETLLILAMPGE